MGKIPHASPLAGAEQPSGDIASRHSECHPLLQDRNLAAGRFAHADAASAFPAYVHYRVWPPTPARDEHYSIVFLEPFGWRNQRAFGYDMFSDRTRRAAMIQARDTGLPAASGHLTLVRETATDRQDGFLIYVPVYRPHAATATPAQRRAALVGFVYAPFRVNDLFRAAFAASAIAICGTCACAYTTRPAGTYSTGMPMPAARAHAPNGHRSAHRCRSPSPGARG